MDVNNLPRVVTYAVADWPGVELAIFRSRANALTTEPPSHPLLLTTHVKPATSLQLNVGNQR